MAKRTNTLSAVKRFGFLFLEEISNVLTAEVHGFFLRYQLFSCKLRTATTLYLKKLWCAAEDLKSGPAD